MVDNDRLLTLFVPASKRPLDLLLAHRLAHGDRAAFAAVSCICAIVCFIVLVGDGGDETSYREVCRCWEVK